MENHVIRTDKLVKKYKNRTVVNEVSINFTQGEIVGLLGPNGAGKTTSFYMIVGLIKPFSGRIFLDDKDISEEPMYKRAQMGIAYLPQEASVFRQMTVEDNIRAILEFSGKILDVHLADGLAETVVEVVDDAFPARAVLFLAGEGLAVELEAGVHELVAQVEYRYPEFQSVW